MSSPKFVVVHLYDVGSSHPEVDLKFFTSYDEALEYVQDLPGFEDFETTGENEWELEDEGWVRIDKVE